MVSNLPTIRITMESDNSTKPERKKSTSIIVSGLAGLSVIYLICPSVLPDIIPVVGSLDEAAATTLLISCLAYFGFDASKLVHLILSLIKGEAKPTRVSRDKPSQTIDVEVA